MKNFTRTNQGASRKSEEITATPERTSSWVQGKKKLGRGDTNSFAPLQDDNDNEVVDNDKTMKDATKKSGGGTAMKDTTKKSVEQDQKESQLMIPWEENQRVAATLPSRLYLQNQQGRLE